MSFDTSYHRDDSFRIHFSLKFFPERLDSRFAEVPPTVPIRKICKRVAYFSA